MVVVAGLSSPEGSVVWRTTMTPTGGGYGGAGVPFLGDGEGVHRIGRIQMPFFWRMCVEVLGRGHAGPVKVFQIEDGDCSGGGQRSVVVGWTSGKPYDSKIKE